MAMTMRFQDAEYIRNLNAETLKNDFDLEVEFRSDRLCPPVQASMTPSDSLMLCCLGSITVTLPLYSIDKRRVDFMEDRKLYVEWITALAMSGPPNSRLCLALDIGTGSVAIYPLLACKTFPSLHFLGTELDPTSLSHSKATITSNGLNDRISLIEADPYFFFERPAIFLSSRNEAQFDFSICNPPFYASAEQIKRSREAKAVPPTSVNTAADIELITDGGERAFVERMIRESTQHPSLIRWYSTLLGFLSSVDVILSLFERLSIRNYTVGEYISGRTKRWLVAWSFDLWRPIPVTLLSSTLSNSKRVLPPTSLSFDLDCSNADTKDDVAAGIQKSICLTFAHSGMKLEWIHSKRLCNLTVSSMTECWSRKARRAISRGEPLRVLGGELVCEIDLKLSSTKKLHVESKWVKGYSYRDFESLSGSLFRQIRSHVSPTP